MRTFIVLTLLALAASPAQAFKNQLSNWLQPFPPSCASNFDVLGNFNDSNAFTVVNGNITASDQSGGEHDLNVRIFQVGCAESGRRILFMELTPVVDADDFPDQVFVPDIFASISGDEFKLRLAVEPDTHAGTLEGTLVPEGETRIYFVGNVSLFSPLQATSDFLGAEQYNAEFFFILEDRVTGRFNAIVPPYDGGQQFNRIPLSGYLSGNWASAGVPDQGFLVAFNELVFDGDGNPDSLEMVAFLSWYTFDAQGNLLWLAGSGIYQLGDRTVTVDMRWIQSGTFQGSQPAQQVDIPDITLFARSCNELVVEYDLGPLGLGAGTLTLERLFAAEIQGFACRDFDARFADFSGAATAGVAEKGQEPAAPTTWRRGSGTD